MEKLMHLYNDWHTCSQFTKGTSKFVNQHITWKFLVDIGCKVSGRTPSRIWKFFTLPMLLSTWILNEAISWVSKTSSVVNCALAPLNGGIFNLHFFCSKTSRMVKPLSAITLSFSSSKSINPDSIVIWRSDVFPGQPSETNEITPDGVIPTRNLIVVWCL